uniref:Uncharacterized protein n=2 Tax=Physcomitrium patens TaxID=3218 RepID=A0A7I3ZT10_PHYPA
MMEWLLQCSILNPIEYLQIDVDRCLRLFDAFLTSKDDWWEKIQVIWHNIKVESA